MTYQQQQPYQPYPPQGPMQPQPPQKKSGAGKKIGLGCLGLIVVLILFGVLAAAMSGGEDGSTDGTAVEEPKDAAKGGGSKDGESESKKDSEGKKSQAAEFQAFVAENGTPAEKSAVQHVTKVQGAGEQNDILDAADVYTDYAGGITGAHAGDGKLIASAFADWKNSKNGLVTVYDKDGEILSNGNF